MSGESLILGLLPDLATKAREHRARAEKIGITVVFTAGYRTAAEQTALFAKGRVLEGGVWHIADSAKVVTNAMPESAPHCRRAAYDLVPIVNEKPAWDRLDLFAELGRIGKDLGLVWGGDWPKLKDMPHFELPGWRLLPLPAERSTT
jgi:peptidoglycan L-alanyl-D-glutamate endopeptidase CwlK